MHSSHYSSENVIAENVLLKYNDLVNFTFINNVAGNYVAKSQADI